MRRLEPLDECQVAAPDWNVFTATSEREGESAKVRIASPFSFSRLGSEVPIARDGHEPTRPLASRATAKNAFGKRPINVSATLVRSVQKARRSSAGACDVGAWADIHT